MPQNMYSTPIFVTKVFHLVTYIQLFKWLLSESNGLYNASLVSLGWFLQHASIVRPRPTNDTDYSCDIKAAELFNLSYGVHIMPPLGRTQTHT